MPHGKISRKENQTGKKYFLNYGLIHIILSGIQA